ncbi:MAG: TonB-dependent receptor, partial [Gammaproteobacteria bacterium]|nr:TonB-dependent receptor [Gammaproteobacteria bacterium]
MNTFPYGTANARMPLWSGVALISAALSLAGFNAYAAPLEELVVTATKREENIQDVPIAISAFGSEQLRDAGVRDIRDLQTLAPTLVLTSTQSETAGTTARIRGVGTTGDNLGLESSVAVFIDGVYRNRNNVALTELGNIDRIEVLRGPQGTLFGKNASAGLIHIITARPGTDAWGGYVEGMAGEWDAYSVGLGVNGPIAGEKLALGLNGSYMKRDEGFITDVANPGVTYNDRDRYLIRADVTSQPTDTLDMRLILDYAEREESCCGAVSRVAGAAGTAAINGIPGVPGTGIGQTILPPDPFARNMTSNPERGYLQDVEETGGSFELNWDVFTGTVTSITSYRNWDSGRSQDADYTNADIFYRAPGTYENEFDTFTQELRFAATVGRLDYLFGLYYVDEELKFRDAVRGGRDLNQYANNLQILSNVTGMPPVAPTTGLLPPGSFQDGQGVASDDWGQQTDSWAIFTHNTFHVTDRLDLTLGLRYTDEDKELNGSVVSNNPACMDNLLNPAIGSTVKQVICNPLLNPFVDGMYADNRNDNEVTGTLNISYTFADEWIGYGSYSRGYKAGGYNLDRGGLDSIISDIPGCLIPPSQGGIAGSPECTPEANDLEFEPETVDSFEIGAKGTISDWMTTNISLFYATFNDFQLNEFTGTAFIVTNLEEATSKGVELELQAAPTNNLSLTGGLVYQEARYGN